VVPQLSGNLPVEQAAHNKRQYFAFARRERVVPCSLFGNITLLLSICAVALDGLVNRIEQRLVAKRLGQKLNRTGLHSLHSVFSCDALAV
jgi:hypothetical protein